MTRKELVQLFMEELFIPSMQAQSKEKAISELLDKFVEAKIIKNREIILEMLHKRESLGSTGIGKGVAIPHGRSTATPEVRIAFGKIKNPLEYNAIDNKLVQLFFMVLAPPQEHTSKYLPALGKLVEIVSESKTRKKLLKVNTFSEFIAVLEGDKSD